MWQELKYGKLASNVIGMIANTDVRNILKLAEMYFAARKLSLTTVSLYASNQGMVFLRLRSGEGITVRRRDRILQWFSDHWPADLAVCRTERAR